MNPNTTVPKNPPMKPSQVFFGESCKNTTTIPSAVLKNLCFLNFKKLNIFNWSFTLFIGFCCYRDNAPLCKGTDTEYLIVT
uniref:Uncharacterized protein n=1 Tax=Anguilla anguilla TaxID=7936 RepID=A0A0E9S2N1_ANGAN